MLEESRRPITFIAMFDRDDLPDALRETMAKVRPMIARGARPQTSPLPLTRELTMRSPFAFGAFPSWKRLFEDTSKAAQSAVYKDVNFRNQFREDLKRPASFADWGRITVHEVRSAGLKRYEGRTVADIAAERGVDGVDALLDVTLEDDLENEFTVQSWNTRADRMAELLNDRSVLLGLGDGGAHLDMLCDSGYPTYVLGTWVRERKVLSLEEAVRRMTSDPADFFGIRDRGRLKAGQAADIVIFDPATVGSGGRPERLHDLPGGAKRMVVRSRGIEMTLVNGEPTWEKGQVSSGRLHAPARRRVDGGGALRQREHGLRPAARLYAGLADRDVAVRAGRQFRASGAQRERVHCARSFPPRQDDVRHAGCRTDTVLGRGAVQQHGRYRGARNPLQLSRRRNRRHHHRTARLFLRAGDQRCRQQ